MAASSRTVKVKFDGDAKGLAAAAKAGEREVDKFSKSTDKKFKGSGEKNAKSFADGFKRAGAKFFGNAAENLTGIFSRQFGTAVSSNPYIGAAVVGTLVAAATIAGPAAGAIAASGLVLGVGGGLAAVGLMFAAKSEQVKAAWSETIDNIGDRTRTLSKPFERTLFAAAEVAERTFARFDPALERSFAKMAPRATKFVDQFGRAFEELEPAVEPLTDAFDAVLDTLGPAFQSAMRDASRGLQDLARSVEESPEGLADLVRGAGQLTRESLDLVRTLNDANQEFDDLLGASAVEIVMRGITAQVFAVKTAFEGLTLPIRGANAALDKLGLGGDETARVAGKVSGSLGDAAAAAGAAGVAADKATKPVETLAEKFDRQWRATQKANEELFRNSGLLLTLSGAQIGYEEAVDRATESVRENGRTHDKSTEAGRNNQRALDDLAASAKVQTEAIINSNKGNSAAAKSAETARAAYVKTAIQMGYSAAEARRMAADFIKIPKKTEADFKGDITDLDSKIKSAKAKLRDPNLTATKRAKLEAYIGQLLAAKRQAQAAINALQGKTVYITAIVRQRGSIKAADPRLGEPGRASGGPTQPNRDYLLGERGPEIARFGGTGTGGPRILSAEQTRRELASGSGPIIVENHIEIGGEVVRVVKTEIKANDRDTKRRVTAGVR